MGPENRVVTLKLVRYSLLMVLIPLAVFYILFVAVYNRDKKSLGICGIAAVIATNVVIGSYVVMAFNEKDDKAESGDSKKKSD
jgi:hypothetical protein